MPRPPRYVLLRREPSGGPQPVLTPPLASLIYRLEPSLPEWSGYNEGDVLNNNPPTTLLDSSGFGNTLTVTLNGVTFHRPLVNGMAGVSLSGQAYLDLATLSSGFTDALTAFTICAVVAPASPIPTAYDGFVAGWSYNYIAGGAQLADHGLLEADVGWGLRVGEHHETTLVVRGGTPAVGTAALLVVAAAPGATGYLRVNGATVATVACPNPMSTRADWFSIGGAISSSQPAAEVVPIDVGALFVYATMFDLTGSSLPRAEAYLKQRYGTP